MTVPPPATTRLAALNSHLSPNQSWTPRAPSSPSQALGPSTMTTQQERPYITCHVLDTVAGRPGANIAVQLRLLSPRPSSLSSSATTSPSALTWTARTNDDGRVTAWQSEGLDLNQVIAAYRSEQSTTTTTATTTTSTSSPVPQHFSLSFASEEYFGAGKTFFPSVEIHFAVNVLEEHYHVPVLLGPWSYTTYRGS